MKYIIVTGANCGLGFLVTKKACRAGHHVIMACRSMEKGKTARDQIETDVPGSHLSLLPLDLSDFSSVRSFVAKFNALDFPLDILINNAGTSPNFWGTERQTTAGGLEVAMATNHVGPFLLTNLLLPNLRKRSEGESMECRIVMVTSSLTNDASIKPIDLDDIMFEKPGSYVDGKTAYVHSKLGGLMFATDMADRLLGSRITVNSVCPGFIPNTELSRSSSTFGRFFMRYIMASFIGHLMTGGKVVTPDKGSENILDLALSDDLKGVSGAYFKDRSRTEPNQQVLNKENRTKMWAICEKYTAT